MITLYARILFCVNIYTSKALRQNITYSQPQLIYESYVFCRRIDPGFKAQLDLV